MVEEPLPVIEGGLKFAVAPLGKPLALQATVPLKPLAAVTVVVYAAVPPDGAVCELWVALTEKPDTFSVTVVVLVMSLLSLVAPVTVKV
jgi:hypothetical protein